MRLILAAFIFYY